MSTEDHPEEATGRSRARLLITVGAVAAVGCAAYVLWKRRQPHLVATPERKVSSKQPVLIINPGSGGGKAAKIDLAGSAAKLGIETIVRKKGQKLQKLAKRAVDEGCDHLLIAGGDGSQARIAKSKDFQYTREDVERTRERIKKNSVSLNRTVREGELKESEERRKSRNKERRARFQEMEAADAKHYEFYRMTLDNIEDESLPKVNREKDAEAFMRRAKGDAEDLDDTPLWPSGLDPVKREGLNIAGDLIELTEAARTAGVLKKQ